MLDNRGITGSVCQHPVFSCPPQAPQVQGWSKSTELLANSILDST